MRERQPGDRLRVVIAGNIHAKRALVRRFLEDDGFDVVAEALTADELLKLTAAAQADAVVVDGDFLDGSVDGIRALAPDAAIIVFTNHPGVSAHAPAGADGYLEKGMGLASLTAMLHSLLSETPAAPLGLEWAEPPPTQQPERRVLAGLAGVAAAIVLVAVVALAIFGGVGTTPPSNPIAQPASPSVAASTEAQTPVELAIADLHELQDALAAGRYVEAQYALQSLLADRSSADLQGFSVSSLNGQITATLQPLLGGLVPSFRDTLRRLLGGLLSFPTATEPGTSGGSFVGGETTSSPTGGTATGSDSTSGGGTTGGDTSGGGDSTGGGGGGGGDGTSGGGEGGGGDGTGGGGGGGGTTGSGGTSEPPSHGNGHHYGWVNKPPKGGWHGTKPHDHGNGKGHGHKHD